MQNRLNDLYFNWLYSIAFPGSERITNDPASYSIVLRILYETEFDYVIPLDENRKRDGIDLRYHFSYNCKIPEYIINEGFNQNKCSILEMMISLARRYETDVMSNLECGDRTSNWFWIMFDNLGMSKFQNYSITNSTIFEIKEILHRFVYREYNYDGSNGNLFIFPNTTKNIKQMQLWDQIGLYMMNNSILI